MTYIVSPVMRNIDRMVGCLRLNGIELPSGFVLSDEDFDQFKKSVAAIAPTFHLSGNETIYRGLQIRRSTVVLPPNGD